nr:deoxyribodipyrimidine photo-lyase [Methylonatrum kenyense]
MVWFRRDLRLHDNPALLAACAHSAVIPIYLHCPAEDGDWKAGGASRWWLHHSLTALATALRSRGSRLIIRRGENSRDLLQQLIEETGATAVHWNRLYESATRDRDAAVKSALRDRGLDAHGHNAALLREPWMVKTQTGTPYRAFTPFWRAASKGSFAAPRPAPQTLQAPANWPQGLDPDELGLLPRIRWDQGLEDSWTPGEDGAWQRLQAFLRSRLADYDARRDLPAVDGTSRLSPHLHFGEIGPRQIVSALQELPRGKDRDSFLSEIGWREFAHHLLYQNPEMPDVPLDHRFERFPWSDGQDASLQAWQRGETGIPIVDAGMRQLWQIGWMHNRVRMIVGSLLTKNLRVPWQRGEAWFWDTLVDADLASNSMGWQWIQGSGADAAPYFRIFNPIRQGERFDPDGDYVRRWVPELARLPAKFIHAPWQAPAPELNQAGLRLGHDYPQPIVDLANSRKQALDAYAAIKSA